MQLNRPKYQSSEWQASWSLTFVYIFRRNTCVNREHSSNHIFYVESISEYDWKMNIMTMTTDGRGVRWRRRHRCRWTGKRRWYTPRPHTVVSSFGASAEGDLRGIRVIVWLCNVTLCLTDVLFWFKFNPNVWLLGDIWILYKRYTVADISTHVLIIIIVVVMVATVVVVIIIIPIRYRWSTTRTELPSKTYAYLIMFISSYWLW